MGFWGISPKSPIQKSCETSQNFCMGFWETPALADCLNNFIFLNVASREVCVTFIMLYKTLWHFMTLYNALWPFMKRHDALWCFMMLHYSSWHFMTLLLNFDWVFNIVKLQVRSSLGQAPVWGPGQGLNSKLQIQCQILKRKELEWHYNHTGHHHHHETFLTFILPDSVSNFAKKGPGVTL